MAKLVVSTFVGSGGLWLFLDDKLILQNSDTVTLALNGDDEHVVHWFVRGEPGSSYSITISSPREAEFQLTRCVGKGGKEHGGLTFRT